MGRRQHELGLEHEPLANGGRSVEVFQTGTTFYSGRADADPGMVPGLVSGLGIRSFLAVPLQITRTIAGVLTACSAQPDRFGEDERQFFEAVARWLALVARRAERTETLRQAAVEDGRRGVAEELVTLLAHDLGNALTPVRGRIDLLRRRLLQAPEMQRELEDVEVIAHSIERTQHMVSELLDVARIDHGIFLLTPRPMDAVPLIDDICAEFRPLLPGLAHRLPDELPLTADPGRLTQVLQNLLANAVAHLPDGVPVIVSAETEVRDGREWAVIEVHDDGHGMDETVVHSLFTRFASGPHSTGLGIGLYLSRRVAEAHGGTLTVESAPGAGTTFQLLLPTSP
jgi:signal transduction histidine kinase